MGGAEVSFTEEDLLISTESAKGFISASDKGITVALNTEITPELFDEGVEREVVSKIQTMRKEAGFEVTDRIRVYYKAGKQTSRVLKAHKNSISTVVLADVLEEGEAEGYSKDWEFAGEPARFTVVKNA